ncbi:hypothetical protein [Campylobacter mucosalis]|uniref:hypothetical protein n=1 Tax=Campylobacter mucosalis TaxID=202 RepID=UPI00147052D4|nr:hypothetical protein [Campylobacter mucosalis]
MVLIILSIVGIFITGVLFFYIFLQNFFLFNSWHKSSHLLKMVFILVDSIIIVLMALAPYIYVYFEIKQDINIIMNWSMCLFILLLSIFSIIFWRNNRNEKDSIINVFMAFAMILIFDLIMLLVIYFSYDGDYLIVGGFIVVFSIFSRALQIYNKFSYNLTMFIASIIVFTLFIGYSQFLVRVVGIANYQTDFVINKKHTPSYIIDLNITKCSDISHKDDENVFDKYTCVLEEKDNNVLFKDILVKVKSNGRYWLEVVYRKDDRTKTKDFWVSEKI